MSFPRPLLFRRDERISRAQPITPVTDAAPALPKNAREYALDRLVLTRLASTASSRASNTVEVMCEHNRISCASMRSQF